MIFSDSKKTNNQTVVLGGGLRNNDVHNITNYEMLTLSQALLVFHVMLTEPQEVASVTTTTLQMRKQKHRWVCNLRKTTKLVRHRARPCCKCR